MSTSAGRCDVGKGRAPSRLGRIGLAASVGAASLLAVTAGSAQAIGPVQTFVRTTQPISEFALVGDDRAVWSKIQEFGDCESIHGGNLVTHSFRRLTPRCVHDGPFGSTPIGGHRVAATALPGTTALRAIWSSFAFGNNETDYQLMTNTPAGRAVVIGGWYIDCGITNCFSGGNGLGPIAGRDGTLLYSILDYTVPTGCQDNSCFAPTGGSIRRVVGGDHPPVKVPGAPGAAVLATGGGRFAEQPYASPGQPAPFIQIRQVASGKLLATVPITGTVDRLAMSRRVLAVLTTDASQNRIATYNAKTGAPLDSIPLKSTVDPTTLDIHGKRIVYQLQQSIRIYRTDQRRAHSVYVMRRPRRNLSLDAHGLRWLVQNHLGGNNIIGVNLAPIR